jgi:hypothetical protein
MVSPLQYRKPLMSDDTDGLKAAIEREHGGTATFIGTELVTAMWQGLIAWQGVVQVYAPNWRGAVQDGVCVVRSSGRKRDPRRVHTALKAGSINTASDAVNAAILANHRPTN